MTDEIRADIDVASGRVPPDITVRNGRFLDVFTGGLITGDMAVRKGIIVGVGPVGCYRGRREIDLRRRVVVPGLIDSHVHIESSMLAPSGFAGITVPRGTTTVIADPHEIANVRGMDGIRWLLDASEPLPQSVFVMLPSCVPATPFEDTGAVLDADDLAELMDHPRVLGLGEAMDYPGVAAARDEIVEKIALARRIAKRVDGHSPGMSGRELAAYAVAGISTDHECGNIQEMKERLRLGIRVLIREGTAARDLAALIAGVDAGLARRCAFCTDDKLPGDILNEGHIDFNVRSAIERGLNPVEAVRLGTLNAAEAYGLDDRGALSPGRRADFVVLDGELSEFRTWEVYRNGEKVAENGRLLEEPHPVVDTAVRHTVRLGPLGPQDLELKINTGRARVITMSPGTLVTGGEIIDVPTGVDGSFESDGDADLLKLVVVERHKGTGRIGLGVVKGYGLAGGAAASSIAHDSHNLIAVGDDDAAILTALRALATNGGGISLSATGGESLGVLPLPLGGLMSDRRGADTADHLERLIEVAHRRLGVRSELNPFMPLSFLALPVIPDLKLTARGLFDVRKFEFVPVAV